MWPGEDGGSGLALPFRIGGGLGQVWVAASQRYREPVVTRAGTEDQVSGLPGDLIPGQAVEQRLQQWFVKCCHPCAPFTTVH